MIKISNLIKNWETTTKVLIIDLNIIKIEIKIWKRKYRKGDWDAN